MGSTDRAESPKVASQPYSILGTKADKSPYNKVDKVEKPTGMESAKPAFTIKPTVQGGGPMTSTPKPGNNSTSTSLRKKSEANMSPAEKKKMEETRQKMEKLEKEEASIRAKLNLAETSSNPGVNVKSQETTPR